MKKYILAFKIVAFNLLKDYTRMTRTLVTSLLLGLAIPMNAQLNQTDAKGKQGKWEKRTPSNILIYTGQFKDDKPFGEFHYYYETGELKIVNLFSDNGKVVRSKMYFESKKLMAEGKYISEKKDSTWLYYSDDGRKVREETYLLGKKNGIFITWNYDSTKARSETYKMDVLNGPCKEWFEGEHLKSELNYVNGVLDGKAVYCFPDGKVSAGGMYVKGQKNGIWNFSNSNGSKGSQDVYKNGVCVKSTRMNGEFEDIYPKSNIVKGYTNYVNGYKHGPFTEYYEAGKFVQEVVPPHDNFPEEVKQVFVGQKIKRSGTYKADKLNGKVIYYKLDGTIEKTEMYKDGVLQQ